MQSRSVLGSILLISCAAPVSATVYDLKSSWSDASNPNGVWSYREASNALPHVASWQSSLGGWSSAQPGWAESENGSDRLPFFFKSNGTETFTRDYLAGDIIVHTTDPVNGSGNGMANYAWTSPESGVVSITGGVWIGRDIGRSSLWALAKNGAPFSSGSISSGDAFSRATPFAFSAGSGGAAAVVNIPISIGDVITLTFDSQGGSGDFVGTELTLTTAVPEPVSLGAMAIAGLTLARRQRRA